MLSQDLRCCKAVLAAFISVARGSDRVAARLMLAREASWVPIRRAWRGSKSACRDPVGSGTSAGPSADTARLGPKKQERPRAAAGHGGRRFGPLYSGA